MLQLLNTWTIVLQMSTWHQWRRQGNWLQPKPGLRPPKAARQSDRFVKTWLESLSGRRWGGNLGWMEFKIHLLRAEKQTGRRWLITECWETRGSNNWGKNDQLQVFQPQHEKEDTFKLFLGGWQHSNVLIVNCCFWRRSFLLQSTLKKHKTFRWKVGRGWHQALSDLNAWLVEPDRELNTNHLLSPKPH